MPFATFHDLWLEASDPAVVAHFWGTALALERGPLPGGGYQLGDPQSGLTMNVMPSTAVPMSTLAGFRIHVDVDEEEVDRLRSLGACRVDDEDGEPWLVLRGPEDSELRCFPTPEPVADRRYEIVLAATQPVKSARWWARVFGAVHESAAGGDYAWVAQVPDAPFETLLFTNVESLPARRRVRMRLATSDMPGLIRYGAAMVAGQLPPVIAHDDPRPSYVMRCADGLEFIVVDTSGAPESARTSRPAKPYMGPR